MWGLEKAVSEHLLRGSTTHCYRATGQKGRGPTRLPGFQKSFFLPCSAHRKEKKKKKANHFSSSLSCFTTASQRSTIFTHFWKPATRLVTTSLMALVQVLFNQVPNLWAGSSNGTWHHRQVICWGQSSHTGHLCLLSPLLEHGLARTGN